MRRLLVAGAILCALPGHAAAAPTFSPERIEADVRFLADDLLEGRGTGTRGFDIAALYVAERFKALGLTPGNGTSWFQPIEFVTTQIDGARESSLTINGTRFPNFEHVIIGSGITDAVERGTAPVVFVGYGLEEPALGLDDYRGLEVRGKIVAMLWGNPTGIPSEAAAALQREKIDLAAAKGAVGVLTINTPVRETVSKWESQVEGSKLVRMRWIGPDGRPHDPQGPLILSSTTLDPAATNALFAGTPLGNGGLFRAIANRSARPRGMPLPAKVSVERFSVIDRARSANVIGFIPGSDPALAGEVVLLSAHLDHLGIKPNASGDTIYNGALDNASGIATMLEAARAFAESDTRPKRSVAFIAVTAEEKGLLGSEFAANNPLPRGLRPIADVNLDMPIMLYDFTDVIAFGAEHSTMGETITRAIKQLGVTLSPDPVPEQNLFVRSDHYNFVRKGVPSVFLKPGIKNGGSEADTWFRTTHYHKVSDDLALPLNWKAGAKFAQLNYLIARELAETAQRPLWYEGDYFGTRYAKDDPKAKR